MAIHFKYEDKKIKLFHKDIQIADSQLNRKLIYSGPNFISMLDGTCVENIPKQIHFYIGDIQDAYPSLSAISLDNSPEGIHVSLISNYIDLGSWTHSFSFDEYIKYLQQTIDGLTSPIKKLYNHKHSEQQTNTVLRFEFLVSQGNLIAQISSCVKKISAAEHQSKSFLHNRNLLNDQHSFPEVNNFIEGEIIALEENATTEFKEVKGKNPKGSIEKQVIIYILAFLNAEGGRILWGICDNRVVNSLRLTSALKDDIKKAIYSKIDTIDPAIDPTQVKIIFHQVLNVEEGYVLEVRVSKGDRKNIYFNTSGECWVRLDGVNKQLKGPTLHQYIIQHEKNNN